MFKPDYIVVGAGSAGAAVAARLSEDPTNKVLLIEAGPDAKDWHIDMPLAVDYLLTTKTYNWDFEAEPADGLRGRVIIHPRGRVLGGSSAINGMVYTRGNPQDYDEWRDNYGCDGWGYEDVLPYFRRMETAANGPNYYRGDCGPIRTTMPDVTKNPLNQAFLDAGRVCGYPMSDDYNGAQHEGFAVGEQSIFGGVRQCTAKAYLNPEVRRRTNLTILPGTQARRIIFDGNSATGVLVRQGGLEKTMHAEKEVILSAGAIGSPHLLMLSGIGPAPHLKEHGIEIVADRPSVGRNLQDHPDLVIQFESKKPVSLLKSAKWPLKALVGVNWFMRGKGPAGSNQFETAAYIRTRAGLRKPNLKLEFFPLAISHKNYKPYDFESFQIHMTIMASPARGSISLVSADAETAPKLDFKYLENNEDIQTFREAIDLVRELVASAPFEPFKGQEVEPGIAVKDKALDEWIRNRMGTAYHPTCSCRMGGDAESVVDPQLRVRGTERLRIADASIMPHVVTANTNATSIMIGEKAADLCLGKHESKAKDARYYVNPNWETSQR